MSNGIIPKSKLHADKDIPTPKREESYHSGRVEKEAATKNWKYLADELEKDVEDYVQGEDWKDETGVFSEDDDEYYNFFDPTTLFNYPSQEIEISDKTKKIKLGQITFKGDLTKLL